VIAVIFVIRIVIVPQWTFVVTTDKSSYHLGEEVQISVSLANHGLISRSFTSPIANPVVVAVYEVSETSDTNVWYSPPFGNETTYVISAGQALVRTFTWNQTNTVNTAFWNTTYKAGQYLVDAFIPQDPELNGPRIFSAKLYITVTPT
jgi:hypothetical protein